MLVLYSYMKIKPKQDSLFIYMELGQCTQDLEEVEHVKSCIWNFTYRSNYEAAFCLKSKKHTSQVMRMSPI